MKIQALAGQTSALMLLMDMKVRWSSTFNMLARALDLKEVCNVMIYQFIG